MLNAGRQRRDLGKVADRLTWCVGNAEALPSRTPVPISSPSPSGFATSRTVTAIAEAHRILKPGGRFLCLEFSQVDSAVLARLYDAWSFNVLPRLGQLGGR